jgi:hypothetical protein
MPCLKLIPPNISQDVFPKVFLLNPPGWSDETPFGMVCPASV